MMKIFILKQRMLYLVILGLIFSLSAYAQEPIEISGTVTTSDNLPLPGVDVIIANSQKGTTTDFDGNYTITSKEGEIIEFKYFGFISQSVTISGQKTINIKLIEDNQSLSEVIVVGYGTRKKSHLTGAIAQIGGEDIAALQVPRVDDALAGKLAGVQIQTVDSQPGAAPRIKVRASGSITDDGNPLIIVDGFQISGDLSTVNPNDIESIEVLKDASSAAIYGSRGANGVILITTKKGTSGKPQFSFNSYLSSTSVYEERDIYPTVSQWVNRIDNESSTYFSGTQLAAANPSLTTNAERASFAQNYDDVFRIRNEAYRRVAAAGYLDAEGAIKDSDFERYNGRLNLDITATDKLKLGISMNGSVSERTIFPVQLHDALRTQNIIPIRHTEESLAIARFISEENVAAGLAATSGVNDLEVGDLAHERHFNNQRDFTRSGGIGLSGDNSSFAKIDGRNRTQEVFFGNVNTYLSYEVIDGLVLKTTLGADITQTNENRNTLSTGDRRGFSRTFVQNDETRRSNWLSENYASYTKIFNDKHDVSAVAGFSLGSELRNFDRARGNVLINDQILNIDATESQFAESEDSKITRRSVYFRTNYAYDNKYLASFSIRRDADSRFGENNRWGTFPAFSVGWNMHNENFFEPLSEVVSQLKLRASFGKLGSTASLGAYDHLSILNTEQINFGGNTEVALVPGNPINRDLSWQVTAEQNYGADFGFLNNRIRGGFNLFISTTEDQLLEKPVSAITGFETINVNQGEIKSTGLELELGATPISTNNFSWTINGNISTVETEIIDLGEQQEIVRTPDPSRGVEFRNTVGGEISEFWGYRTTGEIERRFLNTPNWPVGGLANDVFVEDTNGDGEITEADKVKLGSNNPDFTWGLSNNFKYKNFDLSFTLQGSHGAEIANADPFYYGSTFRGATNAIFNNAPEFENDRNRTAPRVQTDALIQDASYLAIRNLTIGYTLSNNLKALKATGVNSLRVYLASTNLLYLYADDYTSFNPEGVNHVQSPITNGFQRGATPITRSFTLGLNLNF